MNLDTEKFDCIKLTHGKNGEPYYYHKSYRDISWTRISKANFDNYLNDNITNAAEIDKANSADIVFMKYKHETANERRERLKNQPLKEYKAGEFSLIKKTLGKDRKYYYYESLSSVDNLSDVYWYKTDESFFNFLIKEYKDFATKIEYNENKEIVYMVYKSDNKRLVSKNKKGCFGIVLSLIILIVAILSIR